MNKWPRRNDWSSEWIFLCARSLFQTDLEGLRRFVSSWQHLPLNSGKRFLSHVLLTRVTARTSWTWSHMQCKSIWARGGGVELRQQNMNFGVQPPMPRKLTTITQCPLSVHTCIHTHTVSLSFSLSSSQSVSEAQTLWLTNYLEPQSNFLMAAKNVWKAPEQRGGRLGQTRFTLLSYRTCTWPELFRWNEDFQVWFSFIRHWHLWHKKTRIF